MVIIYGKAECPFCDRAKALAKQYNLEFFYKNAYKFKKEFREYFPDAKTVPQIIWNNKVIGGYDEFAGEIVNTIGGYGDSGF